MLVTKFEQDDQSMKKFFGMEHIIPKDIETVRKFCESSDLVLYDNRTSRNKNFFITITNQISSNSTLQLKVSFNSKFKIFFFSTSTLKETIIATSMKTSFHEKIDPIKGEIEELNQKILEFQQTIQNSELEGTRRMENQNDLKTNLIPNLESMLKTKQKELETLNQKMDETKQRQNDLLESIKKSKEYVIAGEFLKIFKKFEFKSNQMEIAFNEINSFISSVGNGTHELKNLKKIEEKVEPAREKGAVFENVFMKVLLFSIAFCFSFLFLLSQK